MSMNNFKEVQKELKNMEACSSLA